MGFCCICFIVYMLCTYIARTKRNYHSQYIVIRKILICVHPLDSCCFSAGLRAEYQGVLFTDVFRENNGQTYFDMGCMYGCGDILFLLLFAYNGSERKYLFVISITIGKLYISADYSTCWRNAWRGFLLERSPFKKKIISVIFVGAVWAVWHMPMWIIRNSLSFGQIVWLCIWTVIVSVVLGMTYYQCRNILLTTMIHAASNICYLAPMQYNVAILAIVISAGTLLYKKSAKKIFDWQIPFVMKLHMKKKLVLMEVAIYGKKHKMQTN